MKKILSYLFIASVSYFGYSQCTTPIAAPWLESFATNTLPTCWTQGGNSAWEFENTNATGFAAYGAGNAGEHTGTGSSFAIGMDGSDNSGADISTLTSPLIDIASLGNPALSYWVFSNNITQACNNEVIVEVFDGTNWNVEESYAQNFGTDYVQRVVSLTAYTGIVQFRFTVDAMVTTCGSAFYNDILFDDIGVIDCTPTTSSINGQSCGFYTAPSGKLLHDAGTYMDTIANSVGCDSVITIALTTQNTFSTTVLTGLCHTFTLPNGAIIGDDGLYYDTIPNAGGCDSAMVFDLTFNNSHHTFTTSACNVYTAPSGATYTLSGVYFDTIPNAAGCDSLLEIGVEMFYDNDLTIFATTCGDPYVAPSGISYPNSGVFTESYTSVNGCDSTVFVSVNIATGNSQTFDIDACDSWTSNAGITYTNSGVYYDSLLAVTGCDSVEIYNVSIHTVNTIATFVSALTAEATETGATYQWVDCNNGFAQISGATSKTFNATVNGDYACEITKNGCTEMTNCVRLGSLGLEDETTTFSVYPNPSNGSFLIELTELVGDTKVSITNAAGQLVYTETLNETTTNISLSDIEAGVYFVSIENETSTAKKAIIIE